MNIISKENLKNNSQSLLSNLIQASSEINGCPITNILSKETKSIWLSDESLPQEIILHINKDYFQYFPKKLSTIGIYCWHAYSTNPKLIEIQISTNNLNNYISLGNFDLGLKPGMQLLHLDEDLLLDNDDNKLNDNFYIKIIIKETFGGKRTYINNLSLYEDIDLSTMNLKSIQEENDEEDTSIIYVRESRVKNNLKKQKKGGAGNNNNILLTSEILISDSDLSERKIFGAQVDKFFGINNSGKKENKENNNSSLKKVNQNKIIISNNNIKGKTVQNNKSPIKPNNLMETDKNIFISDKKSLLNSNLFTGNNNINTQTSQNNLNNQLLTTEMMQNDFFTPEKPNKFFCSKGEISNIEFAGDNLSLINEFRNYQKSQDEKMKKFDERITNIENKINDINSTIININNNLNNLVNEEKEKEKMWKEERKNDREVILKECEQMIKLTLIEILEKKLNLDEEKKPKKFIKLQAKKKENSKNNYINKIPESKLNKNEDTLYQTYYNINNNSINNNYNQNTIDYSHQNITLDPNDNYLTHKIPFYQSINKSNSNFNYNNNSNNNILYNHKRNCTFSLNYINKNNFDSNYSNNINNSQSIKNETKFNISSNNYSQISDSYLKDKINQSNSTPYYEGKLELNSISINNINNTHNHTPNNITNYKIPHKKINNRYSKNLKCSIKDPLPNKEQTLKLKKNNSNITNSSFKKNHNTLNNSHRKSHKIMSTRRQNSYVNLNSKDDIANKINDHLEEKFADFGDKLGKNINESLLKPSIAKLKKIMKTNLKQVRNSLKKAEISHRSVRNNNYSYNS